MLEIVHARYEDMEREKMRNRFPLAILHDRVRFTKEAVIYNISTQRRWYYQKCSQCGQRLNEERLVPKCKDHGPQTAQTYRSDFVLDRVFPTTQLCLPPPEPKETVEIHITPETQSPISQMTTQTPIAETDTDTPAYKDIPDTKITDINAPELSIKKPLFPDEPQTSNPQTPKKQKTKSTNK
nr:replication protein A 70 kDa DNA-binding subunit [Tanacetum cinerariifolium]